MAVRLADLEEMVTSDAALRRRQRLQPVGGQGDKIFPSTYPGEGPNAPPRHVFEQRRIGERVVWCVLADSVQSQANRLELSLLVAAQEGRAILPRVVVDFEGQGLLGISSISSLEAPHRVYDAVLRDSLYGDRPFMESELGRRLAEARPEDASALLEVSPTALLFGAWHSTGTGGGLGAKFARCLTSEIMAVDVPVDTNRRTGEVETAGRRTGSRIDPLGVLRRVDVYKGPRGWDVNEDQAGPGAKKVRPSEINHGNIAPTVQALGVTCDYAEHMFVLSFAGLRRLRFGSPKRDRPARTFLAALGLLALVEQDAQGYALRSRCDLVCDGKAPLECVRADGSTLPVELDRGNVVDLYREAFTQAARAGFEMIREPVRLQPQRKLVQLVQRSQQLALAGEGGEAGGAS